MELAYTPPVGGWPAPIVLTPWSEESIGSTLTAWALKPQAAGAPLNYITANLGIFVPFWVAEPTKVIKGWWANGAAVAGNYDVGVFGEDGTRLVSAGATAAAGVSNIQAVTFGTPPTLARGRYYMGIVSDTSGATQKIYALAPAAGLMQAAGLLQMASAYPFNTNANPAVYAKFASAFIPEFGIQCSRTPGPF